MFRAPLALRQSASLFARRSYSAAAANGAESQAIQAHALAAADKWKKISLYFCFPAIIFASYNGYSLFQEHKKHQAEHPQEFVMYSYMDVHAKDFPFGDGKRTLFFNDKVNHIREE